MTQPRRVALLAYLLLARPRGPHSRDSLVALLWPEADGAAARQALRNALHALRKALGADVIATDGQDLVAIVPRSISCDVLDVEALLAASRAEEAVAAYAELLEGFHVGGAPGFERWLDDERAALRVRLVREVERTVARYAGDANELRALALLRAAHERFPLEEALMRPLLSLLARSGDLRGAVSVYREFATRLADEDLGGPSVATTTLMARLTTEFAAAEDAAAHTTVAVIPFADASPDAALGDVAEALTAGIERRVRRSAGFRLLSRASIDSVRREYRTPEAVGATLGADMVVHGRIASALDSGALEATASVVRVRDGSIVHRTTLRANPRHLLRLESELASALSPALPVMTEHHAGARRRPERRNEEAYVLYVRGTWLFLRAAHPGARPSDLQQARVLFEEALAIDPGFGDAYAGLANYYATAAARGVLTPFREHFGRAIQLSHRALEIDPTLAIPHVHFGVRALYLQSTWEEARREFERAVALDPRYAEARRFLGIVYRSLGMREEAMSQLREAVRLEPHVPMFRNSLADALMIEGELRSAIAELEAALRVDPGYRGARERLVRCHERLEAWDSALAVRDGDGSATGFRAAFERDGAAGYRRRRAEELRGQIEVFTARARQPEVEHPADLFNPLELQLALAHAELGEWEDARKWQAAAIEREPGLATWFRARPELERIRAGA